MLIISDTNILSSLAAGDALPLLFRLFPNSIIQIPPAVKQELQTGLEHGKIYLQTVLDAIAQKSIQVLALSEGDKKRIEILPSKLNQGEREAIVLAKNHHARLLSNDKRAVRYCQNQKINAVDLADLLHLFWITHIVSLSEIEQLITRMEQVENLVLSKPDRAKIFASPSRRRRRKL